MSKARQLADLGNQVDDGAITGTNMVTNGAMNVAQRGTSAPTTVNDSYLTVDRWQHNVMSNSAARFTMSQVTDSPDGFNYSLKYETTTAEDNTGDPSDGASFRQKIEKQDLVSLASGTSDAKPFTISFWVKSSKTGTFAIFLQEFEDNTIMSRTYTINSANTWEYKTVNVPAITGTVFTPDNSQGMHVFFGLSAGANWTTGTANPSAWASDVIANRLAGQNVNIADTVGNTWQITGVCMNVGDSAIDFPHESYGDTLAKCQRYFWKLATGVGIGSARKSDTESRVRFDFPTQMRASPAVTFSHSGSAGSGGDSEVSHVHSFELSHVGDSNNSWSLNAATAEAEL